jgi:CHAD domain-containing protein
MGRATEVPVRSDLALTRDMTANQALAFLVQHCAQEFVCALPLLMQTDDPEGSHKTRVALRRLRSVLDGFRPILGKSSLAGVRAEAKTMFLLIGTLRDAEIAAKVVGDAAAVMATQASVRTALDDCKAAKFSRRVQHQLDAKDWQQSGHHAADWASSPVAMLAELALEVAWSICVAHGEDLVALAPVRRHDLRKVLKTLRYLCDFFAPLWPRRDAGRFFVTLEALQAEIGVLTDLAALHALMTPGLALRAAHDAQAAAALSEADRLWRALLAQGVWWR